MSIDSTSAPMITAEHLTRYIDAARKFREKQNARDFRAGNKFADITFIEGKLLRTSTEGQMALQSLLTHHDATVRGIAAKDCLFFAPTLAIPVLEELAKMPGLRGFAAEMTLKEWRAGRLTT